MGDVDILVHVDEQVEPEGGARLQVGGHSQLQDQVGPAVLGLALFIGQVRGGDLPLLLVGERV